MLMFYDIDFLMKVADEILTQNKLNALYQLGFYEEARHRICFGSRVYQCSNANGASKM